MSAFPIPITSSINHILIFLRNHSYSGNTVLGAWAQHAMEPTLDKESDEDWFRDGQDHVNQSQDLYCNFWESRVLFILDYQTGHM